MRRFSKLFVTLALCLPALPADAGFEGKIEVVTTQAGNTTSLLYRVAGNFLRIEVTDSHAPNPIDLVDLKSGALTILYPHNQSFARLKPASARVAVPSPRQAPVTPVAPAGVAPQTALPALPALPPIAAMGKVELKPTGKKDKILGYACVQFEIKASGETMEVWATEDLISFQPYVRKEQTRFGPRMLEEQWAELLRARKLFPMRAALGSDGGIEGYRFEVKVITPEKIVDRDGKLFLPPADYTEVQPLPF